MLKYFSNSFPNQKTNLMARDKRLSDEGYKRLMSTVSDFATRYEIISDAHETEKTLPKESRKKWSQLCMAQRPPGMKPADWMALIGSFQVQAGITKTKKESSPTVSKSITEPVREKVRFFQRKVEEVLTPKDPGLQLGLF
jgi:hypothetical protein